MSIFKKPIPAYVKQANDLDDFAKTVMLMPMFSSNPDKAIRDAAKQKLKEMRKQGVDAGYQSAVKMMIDSSNPTELVRKTTRSLIVNGEL